MSGNSSVIEITPYFGIASRNLFTRVLRMTFADVH